MDEYLVSLIEERLRAIFRRSAKISVVPDDPEIKSLAIGIYPDFISKLYTSLPTSEIDAIIEELI
jgi:hypothetical protein